MCLLFVKPEGKSICKSDIRDMWFSNPDGAGIAYISSGTVQVIKGIMNLEELQNLLALPEIIDLECVVHLRYATHGKIEPRQTHPFAIGEDLSYASALDSDSYDEVFFHNGTIRGYGNEEISDTLDFTMRALAPLKSMQSRADLLDLIDGKFILISPDRILTIGNFTEFKNLLCSNVYWTGGYAFHCKAIKKITEKSNKHSKSNKESWRIKGESDTEYQTLNLYDDLDLQSLAWEDDFPVDSRGYSLNSEEEHEDYPDGYSSALGFSELSREDAIFVEEYFKNTYKSTRK